MIAPWSLLFLAAVAAWAGAVVLGLLALAILFRRLGRDDAWPSARVLMPLVDLVGTWAGAIAMAALVAGRRGFGFPWAAATTLVALMITLSLYDRAVLMPSLDAAWRRLPHGAGEDRWEGDWSFLYRLSLGMRWSTLAAGIGAGILGIQSTC